MIRIPLLYPDPNLSTGGTAVFYLLYGLGILTLYQVVRGGSSKTWNADMLDRFMLTVTACAFLVVLLIYAVWFHPR